MSLRSKKRIKQPWRSRTLHKWIRYFMGTDKGIGPRWAFADDMDEITKRYTSELPTPTDQLCVQALENDGFLARTVVRIGEYDHPILIASGVYRVLGRPTRLYSSGYEYLGQRVEDLQVEERKPIHES